MGGLSRATAAGAALLIGTALFTGTAGWAGADPTGTSSAAAPTSSAPPSSVSSGSAPSSSSASSTATSSTATSSTATSSTAPPSAATSKSNAPKGPAASSASKSTALKAATAATSPDIAAAAKYLTDPKNLIDGHYYEAFPNSGGFADFGLTIDGALALAATGNDTPALLEIVSWLRANGADGVGNTVTAWTGLGTAYASGGSIAKEALLAEATGYDPRSFGGHDLIAALDATVCPAASTAPDTTCVAKGNYSYSASVFSQALGVIAQLRAGDTANAADPISYLAGLQNSNGSWPSLLPSSGNSDVDSTAMAAMAMALVPGQSAAVAKALTWLAGQQLPDGGFPGAAGDSTNSAALAIQGLSLNAGSYADQIGRARTFLAGQQNADGGFTVASDGPAGSDVRASTQVLGGLPGTSFGDVRIDLPSAAAASRGAAFLVTQLVDGNHLKNDYGPDYGLTADLAFALASAGDQDAALAKVAGYLRAHVVDYGDPAGTTQYPGPYSGAVAKLALVAEVTGQNPHDFGGFDLLKVLTDNVCTAPDSNGLCSAAGDFSQAYSSVSQALGVLALARAGVTVPAAALARLESLQCSDGGFSSTLITAGQTCTSDVDTTGFAAQALALTGGAGAQVAQARSFLLAAQQTDGGFTGAAGENSNSTGLAIQALTAVGTAAPVAIRAAAIPSGTDPIAAGKSFLISLQQANGGFLISADKPGVDVRSTTQAVPALAGATFAALSDPVTPVTPTTPPSSTPPSSTPPSSSSGSPVPGSSANAPAAPAGSGAAAGVGALASTGASTLQPLVWALVLIVLGALAMLLTRRRPVPVRLRARRRH